MFVFLCDRKLKKNHKFDKIMFKINLKILIIKDQVHLNFHEHFIISIVIFKSYTH